MCFNLFIRQHKLRSPPLCMKKHWLRQVFHIESSLTLRFTSNSSFCNLPPLTRSLPFPVPETTRVPATLGPRPHVGTHFPLHLSRAILGPQSTVVSPSACFLPHWVLRPTMVSHLFPVPGETEVSCDYLLRERNTIRRRRRDGNHRRCNPSSLRPASKHR